MLSQSKTEIRTHLESLEDTIIFKLIARAQFTQNLVVYEPGSGFTDGKSLFELRLLYQENMDSIFGRYTVPQERAFNLGLPLPQRSFETGDFGLYFKNGLMDIVNLTGRILHPYTELVKVMCPEGDDGHYGSSVEHDVYALQAISERIHHGAFFVAERKFLDGDVAREFIEQRDSEGIMDAITDSKVEDMVLARIREKTGIYQDGVNPEIRTIVEPEVIVGFFREHVIPLTKEGQVKYLLQRNLE